MKYVYFSMKKIFLSGPMRGMNRQDALMWRQDAVELLSPTFHVLHAYRGRELKETFTDPKGAIVRDKDDIIKSDIIIVNDCSETASMIGTSMEILFAHSLHKPIIAFGQAHKGDYWMDYHITMRVESLEDACNICKQLFHD